MEKYAIVKLTDKELAERKKQYPISDPKRYQLRDGKLVLGDYDTISEAKLDKQQCLETDTVVNRFKDFVDELATELDLASSKIESIIKDHIS